RRLPMLNSRHAAQELSMRVVRLAVRSAAEHAARRRQLEGQEQPGHGCGCGSLSRHQQEQPQEQQQAGGPGSSSDAAHHEAPQEQQPQQPLALLMAEEECADMAFEALSWAFNCASWPIRPQDSRTDTGSGRILDASAVAVATMWWGTAAPALTMAMRHFEEGPGEFQRTVLVQLLVLEVPMMPGSIAQLPSSPPPNLAAALAAGYIPLLELVLRMYGRTEDFDPFSGLEVLSSRTLGGPRLPWLLAYGKPRDAASLLATVTKAVQRFTVSRNVGMTHPMARTLIHLFRDLLCLLSSGQMAVGCGSADQSGSGSGGNSDSSDAAAGISTGSTSNCVSAAGVDRSSVAGDKPPIQQLLALAARAVQIWLPLLGRIFLKTPVVAGRWAALPTLFMACVCALAHAAVNQDRAVVKEEEMEDSPVGEAPKAIAATGNTAHRDDDVSGRICWRQVLLRDTGAIQLVGAVLRVLLAMPKGMARYEEYLDQLQEVAATLECLAAAFPEEVAAALRDGTLPGPQEVAVLGDSASGTQQGRLQDLQRRLMVTLEGLRSGTSLANSHPAELPDGIKVKQATSSELGALFAEAAAQWEMQVLAAVTHGSPLLVRDRCANPCCDSLAGESEAELPLPKVCRSCRK
ncbi:hypothetical protein Agub_g13656, partial [Astrephomene gubernaculifera]